MFDRRYTLLDENRLAELKSEHLPVLLPATWRVIEDGIDGCAFQGERPRLRVIVSFEKHDDGYAWMHLSVSRSDRLPDWEDITYVKELFMGVETTALQVFPPRSKWINIHKYCLHLWRCLDREVVPDFTQGGNSI